MIENMMILAGNANRELAVKIADYLSVPLGNATVGRFSDGEIAVEIGENIRNMDVFIIQPTCAPTNDSLMELLVMIDAAKRSSAGRITSVIPYLGYARQDRRPRNSRVPISAKLMASLIDRAGADRVLTMDLHADQIQGFFDIPTDNVYARPVIIGDIWRKRPKKLTICAPDVGAVVRARSIAEQLESQFAIIDKRRPRPNVAEVMNVIGNIEKRTCVFIDDIVDTANTLCQAAEALKDRGARAVKAYCTHPVLSGQAVERIAQSTMDELVVCNTIKLSDAAQNCNKIRQLDVSQLIGEAMRRISIGDSVSSIFVD